LKELHISLVLYANLASKLGDGEPLLSQAKWPRLRSVRLSTVQCSPQTTATFFSAHPSIKKLVIFGDAVLPTAGSNLPSGILPQLEIVQCKLESVIDILESLPSPHPISHISLSDGTFDYPLKDRFCGLMKRFDNLKRLEFVRTLLPKDIDLIAEAVSQLEWLRIAFRPVTQKREVRLHNRVIHSFLSLRVHCRMPTFWLSRDFRKSKQSKEYNSYHPNP
jgi:hypothetical protein